jgi:hypothetical protein
VDSASVRDLRSEYSFNLPGVPNGSWSYQELKNGLTVTSGGITEQYTIGTPRAAGVFRDLLVGANVGDAMIRNTQSSVKWMLINVGDPLYRPFAQSK